MVRRYFSGYLAIWFLFADLLVLSCSFLVAFRIRLGSWDIFSFRQGMLPALVMSVLIYLAALVVVGLYRYDARKMHLTAFLRVSIAVFAAWLVSVSAVFMMDPVHVPPRSVTAIQFMISLICVLGFRSLIRYAQEFRRFSDSGTVFLEDTHPQFELANVIDRVPALLNRNELRDYLAGRTVMVTGAGGSIGSQLTELLQEVKPYRILLVDNSEYNLFKLEKMLRDMPHSSDLVFRIADVRDEDIMGALFSSYPVDVIFHAAAYKHVPLMERHPVEAFRNNTLATVGMLRLCESFDVEQFVFISTDKAVDPASVLGATKRLAEWYVRAAVKPDHRKIVRFGNVFGSQGSVVPLFLEQIKQGSPLRVTHPDIERYFISARDACVLVLETLLLESEACTYMLKMDPAVKISELAEKMIRHYSFGKHSKSDIEYIGLRPGEKMFEALYGPNEKPVATEHDSIVGLLSDAPYSRAELDEYLAYLQSVSTANRPDMLRRLLFETDLQHVKG